MMKRMSGISEKGKTDEIEMADGLEVEELEKIAFMKIEDNTKEKISLKKIQIRKNFKETAFFFPQLKTDKNGKVRGLKIEKMNCGSIDNSGRRRPVASGNFDEIECDAVILAIGERVDSASLNEKAMTGSNISHVRIALMLYK